MRVFNFQLVLSGGLETAQTAIREALETEGFTVQEGHHGQWKATHGSIAKTMFLGVLNQAKDQREVLDVSFTPDGGDIRVDLHRPLFQAGGGDDAGIEQLRLHDAYKTSLTAVRDRLQSAGLLVSASL